MSATERIPKGIHRFYKNDTFSMMCFGFICALIYECGMTDSTAAEAFQKFMGLDEDQASTRAILQKYYRLREDFRPVLAEDRKDIRFNDTTEMELIVEKAIKRYVRNYRRGSRSGKPGPGQLRLKLEE